MYNYKLLIIITIMILILLGVGSGMRLEPYPKVESGTIDLTQLQFEKDVAALDGQWEFYYNQLLNPGEINPDVIPGYIDMPGSWNKYENEEKIHPGFGYATYRLKFIVEDNSSLALRIPRVRTAYKLWINGELISEAGIVGETRDTMSPQYLSHVSFFEAQKGENEILIQVSNFYHRIGGILESISISSKSQILELKFKKIAIESIIFGSLIFAGIYHLALFFFRRKKDRSSMYFGLFCILIGIRTMLAGECLFFCLFPEFNWEIAHKILTSTYILGVHFILMFFISIFPKYLHQSIIKISRVIVIVFMSIVISTPARIFTSAIILYQVWSIGIIIYLLIALIRIYINREKDSFLICLGAAALLFSSTNDIVFFSPLMDNKNLAFLCVLFRSGSLTSLGQFIFACTNSLLIAKRFTDSMEQEEIMTARLSEINAQLDELVLQRTKDLEESNKKIEHQNFELERKNHELSRLSFKDPLTGVWNRRKYNLTVENEWRRCLRYQRPIALLFADIDYFKRFNDFYGHMAGDECLIKIGRIFKESLSRSTDTVVRYGGEEFIVLLADTNKEDAIKIANMLREKIERLNIPHERSPVGNYVTVSIGVASVVPNFNISYKDLFSMADKALYQAKDAGRNQVSVYGA